jgi:hypothetical protein
MTFFTIDEYFFLLVFLGNWRREAVLSSCILGGDLPPAMYIFAEQHGIFGGCWAGF